MTIWLQIFRFKKITQVITELFIRERKLNILLFSSQTHILLTKKIVRWNTTHYFIVKITNKRKLQQSAFNHSSDISYANFIKIYKKYMNEPYYFLVSDTTLVLDHSLSFWENMINEILFTTTVTISKQNVLIITTYLYDNKYNNILWKSRRNLKIKKCNTNLIEKQPKYLHYY